VSVKLLKCISVVAFTVIASNLDLKVDCLVVTLGVLRLLLLNLLLLLKRAVLLLLLLFMLLFLFLGALDFLLELLSLLVSSLLSVLVVNSFTLTIGRNFLVFSFRLLLRSLDLLLENRLSELGLEIVTEHLGLSDSDRPSCSQSA